MGLRVLHTSDWHLGHSLHDLPRTEEHEAFLGWLLDVIESQSVDALLIAGDIFDVANPSASAQYQWFSFLQRARSRFPALDIVAIAGNHDSASRLDAPGPLLEELAIRVVGRLPRTAIADDSEADAFIDAEALCVPLRDADGVVAAWCAAVPFLRPSDLPRCPDADDELIAGVRRVYAEASEALIARCEPGQARIAMGHCYMRADDIEQLSERKILGGNQHALPVAIFDGGLDYVALGHLHRAHAVGGVEHVRYAGSPIPLSLGEERYPHQVVVASFEGGRFVGAEAIRVPRHVDMLRLPVDGPAPLEEVLAEVKRVLPKNSSVAAGTPKPFVELRVRLDAARSGLRREVMKALEGRHARLVKLSVEYAGTRASLASSSPTRHLQDLKVDEVFVAMHRSEFGSDPSDRLLACFAEMVDVAQHEADENLPAAGGTTE